MVEGRSELDVRAVSGIVRRMPPGRPDTLLSENTGRGSFQFTLTQSGIAQGFSKRVTTRPERKRTLFEDLGP